MLVVLLCVVTCQTLFPVVLWCPVLSYVAYFVLVVLAHLNLIFLTILESHGKSSGVKVKD